MKYLSLFTALMISAAPLYAADKPVPTSKPQAPAEKTVNEKAEADMLKEIEAAQPQDDEEGVAQDVATSESEDVKSATAEDMTAGVEGDATENLSEVSTEPAPKQLYNKPYVGDEIIHKAKYEDTFVQLAREHDLGYVEMRAANPYLDPWMPGEGAEIILPARHLIPDAEQEGIVINLPEMRLYAFLDSYAPPVTHPLGIGRDGLLTPTGTTSITRKKEAPSWRPTPRMRKEDPDLPSVVEPGPMNPLGTHALYLGWPTYAIHGTNRPFGIGRRVSSGCIRLYPEDIESFFKKIPVGTKVSVVNQPIKAAWIDESLYVEAHLTMQQADVMEDDGGVPSYDFTEADLAAIMKVAGDYAEKVDWRLVRNTVRKRAGYPVKVYTKPPKVVDVEGDIAGSDDEQEES